MSIKSTLISAMIAQMFIAFTASADSSNMHAIFVDAGSDNGKSRIIEVDLGGFQMVDQSMEITGEARKLFNSYKQNAYLFKEGKKSISVFDINNVDQAGINLATSVTLKHYPADASAYNARLGLVAVTAKNRPAVSLISTETNQVVSELGLNVDCKLNNGAQLSGLSRITQNDKCATYDYGGDDATSPAYWLSANHLALVDRSNRMIRVYHVLNTNGTITATLLSETVTNTAIKQFVRRNKAEVDSMDMASFYGVEEGSPEQGIAPAVVEYILTTEGLLEEGRVALGRVGLASLNTNDKANEISAACETLASSNVNALARMRAFTRYFDSALNIDNVYDNVDINIAQPPACFNPKAQGASAAYVGNDNDTLYLTGADRQMYVVDLPSLSLTKVVPLKGVANSISESKKHGSLIFTYKDAGYISFISNKDHSEQGSITLNFPRITGAGDFMSEAVYLDEVNDSFYAVWRDGGRFLKVDVANKIVEKNIYVAGVPTHGRFVSQQVLSTRMLASNIVAHSDTITNNGDQQTVNVLANDEGQGIGLSHVTSASVGQFTANDDTTVTFTPADASADLESTWYSIKNSAGQTSWAQVNVNSRALRVEEEASGKVSAKRDIVRLKNHDTVTIDVLANDSGDALKITRVGKAKHGKVEIVDNKIKYTPNAYFNAKTKDKVRYRINANDGSGQRAWGRLNVRVANDFNASGSGVETSPAAGDMKARQDSIEVPVNGSNSTDVLANDSGTEIALSAITQQGLFGTCTIETGVDTARTVTYTHTGADATNDICVYQIADSSNNVDTARIKILVSNGSGSTSNNLSTADDSVSVRQGETVQLDVLKNDTVDSSTNVVAISPSSMAGAFTLQQNNMIAFTAPTSKIGSVVVTYTIENSAGEKDTGLATFTILPADGGVTLKAIDDQYVVSSGQSMYLNVLGNDQGSGLSLTSTPVVTAGSIEKLNETTLKYTAPSVTQQSSFNFEYTATDASQATSKATVTVTLLPASNLTAPYSDNFIDAARFLSQAGFGGTVEQIQALANTAGTRTEVYGAWLDQQKNLSASLTEPYTTLVFEHSIENRPADLTQAPTPDPRLAYATANSKSGRALGYNFSTAWMRNIVYGSDHYRQRVTFSLSQLLVTSMIGDNLYERWGAQLMADYYDILSKNALGNYGDLLYDVTLSPVMANYLTYLGNDKPDPQNNRYPDENYAREVMQLFTIGLWELNDDGTLVLVNGQPVPTYGNDTITELSRVFTGFWLNGENFGEGYTNQGGGTKRMRTGNLAMFEDHHDTGSKTLFAGSRHQVTIPAGQAGLKDVSDALNGLVNHDNTPVFVSRALIKFHVTSNPSPQYISDVAAVFKNNGSGQRGDLHAVMKAILLHPEARNPAATGVVNMDHYGKLQSPMLRLAKMVHAFNAGDDVTDLSPDKGLQFWTTADEDDFLQWPMMSPTVFNFFLPEYKHPGVIRDNDLMSPEFQILTPVTAAGTANRFADMIDTVIHKHSAANGLSGAAFSFQLKSLTDLASNHQAMVDRLNLLLCNGEMSAATNNAVIEQLDSMAGSSSIDKAKFALWAVAVSPDAAILK